MTSRPARERDSAEAEAPTGLHGEIARGGITALAGQGVGKFSGLLLNIILGRFLGPVGYGLYALGSSAISVLASTSQIGLNQGVVRYGGKAAPSRGAREAQGVVAAALFIGVTTSLVAAIALYLTAPEIAVTIFDDYALTEVFRTFSYAIPFIVITGILAASLQALREIRMEQLLTQVFRPLSLLILVGAALMLGYGLTGALWAFVAISVATTGFAIFFVARKMGGMLRVGLRRLNPKKLLRFSIPAFFAGLSYMLLTHTDRLMLGFFSTSSDVGIYSAAAVLALQVTFVLGAFISIFAPVVSELHSQESAEGIRDVFVDTSRWVLALTLPVFLVLLLFPSELMGLYGRSYQAGAIVLVILATAQLFNVVTGPVGMLLQMTGHHDLEFVNGLVLVILNVVLNLFLIPTYGIMGAALATGASLVLIHGARLAETYHLFRVHPFNRDYGKPLLAGIGAGVVGVGITWVARPTSIFPKLVMAVAVVMVYGAVVLALGLNDRDKAVLKRAFRKNRTVI